MTLAWRPVLEAGLVLAGFLLSGVAYHFALRLTARGASHVTLLRSLLVVVVAALIALNASPFLGRILPRSPAVPPAAMAAGVLLPCAWILTHFMFGVNWRAVSLGSLILAGVAAALQSGVPKLCDRLLPAGPTFTDHLTQGDESIVANPCSLARLGQISTNDIAALTDALAQMQALQQQTGTGTVATAEVRSIPESFIAIVTNLTSVTVTEADMAMLNQVLGIWSSNDVERAVAEVKADFERSGGENGFSLALLSALYAVRQTSAAPRARPGTPATGAQPTATLTAKESTPTNGGVAPESARSAETLVRLPVSVGEVWVRGKTDTSSAWMGAAQALRVRGYVKTGASAAVLLEDGKLLEVGDHWRSTYGGSTYSFVVESASDGQIHLALQGP